MAEALPDEDASTPVKVKTIPTIEINMSPILKSSVGMEERMLNKMHNQMQALLNDMKEQV